MAQEPQLVSIPWGERAQGIILYEQSLILLFSASNQMKGIAQGTIFQEYVIFPLKLRPSWQ